MTGGRPIHDPACRLHPEPFPGAWARARCWLALHGQVAVLPLHCTDRLSRIIHPLPPLKRNERLFEGGDTGGNLYIVYSGSLRTSVQQADGDEQVVDFHLPGEIAGDGTGLETFRGSRAVALERTRICAVRLTSLRNLAMQYSDLQEQVYAVLERAKAHTEKHTLMMGWR
ncbi:MAG: Crp/Fnr family transcriptional regulator, partial [Halofilum sp. (in: g-proteobacteria)]